jgi:hypothetical protein
MGSGFELTPGMRRPTSAMRLLDSGASADFTGRFGLKKRVPNNRADRPWPHLPPPGVRR